MSCGTRSSPASAHGRADERACDQDREHQREQPAGCAVHIRQPMPRSAAPGAGPGPYARAPRPAASSRGSRTAAGRAGGRRAGGCGSGRSPPRSTACRRTPDRRSTSGRASTGSRHRARVRCGWKRLPSSAGGAPARRAPAATDAARAAERRAARPAPRSTAPGPGRRRGRRPPRPGTADRQGWRAAARSSRGTSRALTVSFTSPRNASVRCHASRPVQRRPGQDCRSGATASSSSSAACIRHGDRDEQPHSPFVASASRARPARRREEATRGAGKRLRRPSGPARPGAGSPAPPPRAAGPAAGR